LIGRDDNGRLRKRCDQLVEVARSQVWQICHHDDSARRASRMCVRQRHIHHVGEWGARLGIAQAERTPLRTAREDLILVTRDEHVIDRRAAHTCVQCALEEHRAERASLAWV
jgi:hypothetical protein